VGLAHRGGRVRGPDGFRQYFNELGPQAKARGWLEAKLDRPIEPGEEIDPDDLIDAVDTIRVENSAPDTRGRVYDNVADVLGPANEADEDNLGNTPN